MAPAEVHFLVRSGIDAGAARDRGANTKPRLLLIDEIMKVGPDQINDTLLHAIGDIIDWDEIIVDVVITALSAKVLGRKAIQFREGNTICTA